MHNLLTQPFIQARPGGVETLPGVLARLSRDEVGTFPALRPHQGPAWHMFLVQLAALALNRVGRTDIPESEEEWLDLLRGLTPDFPDDEPWFLVVDDWNKPAFMQPPVPEDVKLGRSANGPDALDLLNTSKNHDLKRTIAHESAPQDWVFALISIQTGGTYSKAGREGNYWSAIRTGNIYAPRLMMSLAPRPSRSPQEISPRLGRWFARDVSLLLTTRERELKRSGDMFRPHEGIGLTWLASWVEGHQLQLRELDIWFIEVCRRLRLTVADEELIGQTTGTAANRINDSKLAGRLFDPWTPENKNPDGRGMTLSESGFDYKTLSRVLFGDRKKGQDFHDWELPILLKPSPAEEGTTLLLVAQGIAGEKQKSGTNGFKSRILPIGGKEAFALSLGPSREALHALARQQMEEIGHFDRALRNALALAAAGGGQERPGKEHYELTDGAHVRFDHAADGIFFEHLWARFEAQEKGAEAAAEKRKRFVGKLWPAARAIFEAELTAMPCAGIFRPRAEARAHRIFNGIVRRAFPELFPYRKAEEVNDAAA